MSVNYLFEVILLPNMDLPGKRRRRDKQLNETVTKTFYDYHTWWPRHVSITPGEWNDFQPVCQAWSSHRQGDQDILSIVLGDLYILSVTPGDQDKIPVNYTIAPGDQNNLPVYRTRWPRHDTCQLHHRTRWSRQPTCLSHKVIKTWYLSIAPGDQDILPVHHTKWPGHHTCLSHQVIKTSYLSHQWPRRSMTVNHIRWPRHLTCLGGQDFLPVYHTKCSRSFTYMSHQVK